MTNAMKWGLGIMIMIGAGYVWMKSETRTGFVKESSPVQYGLTPKLFGGTETKTSDTVSVVEDGEETFADTVAALAKLQYKVVRGEDDKKRLHEIFSSRQNLDAAVNTLRVYDGSDLKSRQKERMDAAFYLLRAMEYEQSAIASEILSNVEELILDSTVEAIDERAVKRSVVADRIELYVAFKQLHPRRAVDLERRAQTPLQKQMIQFAVNFYKLNKTGE